MPCSHIHCMSRISVAWKTSTQRSQTGPPIHLFEAPYHFNDDLARPDRCPLIFAITQALRLETQDS